jgi:transcription antitermination protein NusB
MSRRPDRAGRARSLSRKLAMQALYQWQLTGQTAAELRNQYADEEGFGDADADYFRELLDGVTEGAAALDAELGSLIDRPVGQLDPVERAVLMIGLYELSQRLDVPYRVVINEGVELAKRFGATDGHKFVNAVLDRAARSHRAAEQAAAGRARG